MDSSYACRTTSQNTKGTVVAQRSKLPGIGQETLPDLTVPNPITPERSRAFGSIPNLLGRNVSIECADDMQLDKVSPVFLAGHLYGEGEHAVSGIILNPNEYDTILRSPQSFARAVGAKTLAGRGQRTANDEAAFLRSKDHALDSKQEQQGKVITGLDKEIAALRRLIKFIKVPGYAHTTEAELRVLATSAWEISFNNIVDVVARHAQWTQSEKDKGLNAMAMQLTQGAQRERVGYWHDMTKLAGNYAMHRRALFISRQNQASTNKQLIQKELNALYDTVKKHNV